MASIGKLILSESPFAAAVNPQYFDRKVCCSCFEEKSNLSACSKCKMAFYCDQNCQKMDWLSGQHWSECAAFQNLSQSDRDFAKIFVQGRLVARIYGRKTKLGSTPEEREFKFHESLGNVRPRALEDLLTLRKEWTEPPSNKENWDGFRAAFRQIYGKTPPFLGMTEPELAEIYGIVCTNDFNITKYRSFAMPSSYGLALFLQVSRFDHSCQPDLDVLFEGNRMHVKLAKSIEIKELDKLTISYFPLFNASVTEQRKRLLSKFYLFDCQCPLCLDEGSDAKKRYSAKKNCSVCHKALLVAEEAYFCQNCKEKVPAESEDEKKKLTEIGKFLGKPGKFIFEDWPKFDIKLRKNMEKLEEILNPIENVILLQAREKLAVAISDPQESFVPNFEENPNIGNIRQAIDLYIKILASYRHFNVRSVQHAMYAGVLGKLFEKNKQLSEAKICYKKAKVFWTYFTGSESSLFREIDDLLTSVNLRS